MQATDWQSLRLCSVQNSLAVGRDALPSICVLKWGGLGSVLTTRPFLQALRDRFAGLHRIIYITTASNAPLVERLGLVDQIFTLEPRGFRIIPALRLTRRLRQAQTSIFFDLQIHTHRRLAQTVARLSGASRRFGFFRPRESIPPHCHGVYANPFAPVDQLYLEMARLAGAPPPRPKHIRPLGISLGDEEKARALLHGWLTPQERLLVVNPNASATALVRRWPIPRYAATLAALLREMPRLKIALIGSDRERAYVETLRAMLPSEKTRVKNVAGLTSLGSLMALIARADCVLSNDSGPLHLALALDVPTVGLFGPVHPDHNARLGRPERKIILYHPVLCSPCVHHVAKPPCGGNNHCMRMISPEEVADACRVLLSNPPHGSRDALPEWRFTRYGPDADALRAIAGMRADPSAPCTTPSM